MMNNIKLLSLALVVLFCVSCKPEKPNYAKSIQGEWFCQDINTLTIPTNNVFVMSFQEDGTAAIKQGYRLPENGGEQWMESALYSYTINDDGVVSMKGTNPLGENVNMTFSIKKVNSLILEYKENCHIVNDQETAIGRTFWLERSKESCLSKIQGTWNGCKVVNSDSISAPYFRYHFHADYTFDYYEIDGEDWKKLEDVKGTYRVNGHLLSLNQEVISTSKTGYECYFLDNITDNKIQISQWIPAGMGLQGKRFMLTNK